MLKITQIKLLPGQWTGTDHLHRLLKEKAARIMHVRPQQIQKLNILKKSLDARKKPQIFYSFSVCLQLDDAVEKKILAKHPEHISAYQEKSYAFPVSGTKSTDEPPVIVGTGPAGLFCGYYLAKHGYRPILLERGRPVEQRLLDVAAFWEKGILDPESNVQFGEGGAGTFSDGKLNTMVKDPYGRHQEVLRCFVENGGPEEILYDAKPHLGTDLLTDIVKNMRKKIIDMGGCVRFSSCVTDLLLQDGRIAGVVINGTERLKTGAVVLAVGHSARDTFSMLSARKIPMESKSFAVGVRIEHLQETINESQYGRDCPYKLPSASYKVTARAGDGRGVYSFCMCPGGYVVNASSEPGRLAINGMSYQARDGKNANSAMIVTVSPKDYRRFLQEWDADLTLPEPLLGMEFQRMLEERAYKAGSGRIPVQKFSDFQKNKISASFGQVTPQMKGCYAFGDVRGIFPQILGNALEEGILSCGGRISGFSHKDALLSGVESRTSSPVRILRDERMESAVRGLYPCGEGAGYAGGITSAAIDGLKTAEAVAAGFAPAGSYKKGCV